MPVRLPPSEAMPGNAELLGMASAFAARAMRLPTSYEYRIETPRQTLPESYCAGCIDLAFEMELRKWPDDQKALLYTSMSAGAEYDGRAHCHKCGLHLDCKLTTYGGEAELRHFAGRRFSRESPPSEVELYHLWKMLECLAYHFDEGKVSLARRIGRRALAAMGGDER